MKDRLLLALILTCVLFSVTASAQSIVEPRFVNKFLDDFSTPVIVPGQTGSFSFSINNPDPINITGNMNNISLQISIYQYGTLEESAMVVDISNPPMISEVNSPEYQVDGINLGPGESQTITFTITTEKNTPHGSYFSQSTYFVRFGLEFDYEGVHYSMVSRGYFDDVQWDHLTTTDTGAGEVNQTYLQELGYDGIIPDSGFALKIPIPMWPFYLLVLITIFVGMVAFSFFVLDNPGKYPKLERPLLRIYGKARQLTFRFKRKG